LAINKRKVLDSARKHAQKGAKQRALKEYNKLIQADPRDAKLLLEVGDAYRRWGQAEEAIAQYTKVANQYKSDGFDARAVAVLKQILNLDPKRYTAHVSLAELYQRMSLDSDAVGALQTAADGYYRDGRRKEALELLRKMAALDPTNTTSRLKVADLLKQEGLEKEAVQEYEQVVAELTRQGANEQVTVVQERILEIEPNRTDIMVLLAQSLSDLGRPERAEAFAQRAVEKGSEPDHYELLCGIYKSLGNDSRLAETTQELAALYRERGDDDKAREVIQRIPSTLLDAVDAGVDQTDASEVAVLGDDELLEDEDFLVTDEGDVVSLDAELGPPVDDLSAPLENESAEPLVVEEAPAEPVPVEEPLPEGDPDQLFAEATVYLRYGKRDQAITSLKAVLLQDPDHRGALEKLGEAHSEGGDTEAAVGCWLKAAEAARAADDADGYNIIRDRIGALDAEAAAELDPMGEVANDVSETADAVELDFTDVESEAAVPDSADASESMEFDLDISVAEELPDEGTDVSEEDTGDFEIEFEDVSEQESVDEPVESDESTTDLDDAEFELDVDTSEAAPVAESSDPGENTTTAAQIQEDLEEAEFYIQQGLSSEAEAICRRILSIAPNHPSALLKLGEIAAASGADPVAAAEASETSEVEEDEGIELSFDEDAAPEPSLDEAEGIECDLDESETEQPEVSEESEDLAAIMAEAEAAVDAHQPGEESEGTSIEIDMGVVEVVEEDATEVEHVPMLEDPEPPFAPAPVLAEPEPPLNETTDATLPVSEVEAVAAAADDDANFDLAAELADVFEDDDDSEADPDPSLSQSGRSTVEEGFESIFADFKKGVSATIDEGDYDTRFDLGIAYREMGLWDDAISEFQICLASEGRRCESLHMMGLCTMEVGRVADAVSHLEQALAMPEASDQARAGLYFDLGRAQAMAGDLDRARNAFEQVQALEPDFPGVAEQLAGIESGKIVQPESDDGYESFDDIMDDDDVSEAEPLESFDDVIAEVEALPEEQAAAPPAEPAANDDTGTKPGRSGRKKKISFV